MPNLNEKNEYVNYEKRMQPRIEFGSKDAEVLYYKNENTLLEVAEYEAVKYLENYASNDNVDSFPRISEMTGEWYIGDISIEDEDDEIHGYIFMRFLGHYHPPVARELVDDYLGMEFMFYYDKEKTSFVFDGFNTQSI